MLFARHLLATRKQRTEESLSEFLQALHILSKDCSLSDVSAEDYRQELVRDAFINGLGSHVVRQRLLENNTLTVDKAFEIANSLSLAQKHSAAYLPFGDTVAAATPIVSRDTDTESTQSESAEVLGSMAKPTKCCLCGRSYHGADVVLLAMPFVSRVIKKATFHTFVAPNYQGVLKNRGRLHIHLPCMLLSTHHCAPCRQRARGVC